VKLVLFDHDGQPQPGVLADDGVVPVSEVVSELGCAPHDCIPTIIDNFNELREPLLAAEANATRIPLDTVALLAPLPRPRTILCAIANYWEHAQREPRPLRMYVKNPDSVIGPEATIELPETTDPWVFMHEAELALVFRGPTGPTPSDRWRDVVFGYTCLIDVSARGHGRTSWGEFSWLGKSFDTFCPVGPCVVTADEIPDPNDLHVRLWDDGSIACPSWSRGRPPGSRCAAATSSPAAPTTRASARSSTASGSCRRSRASARSRSRSETTTGVGGIAASTWVPTRPIEPPSSDKER